MFLFKKKNQNLYEYHLSIKGMRCGMCESHINNVIRTNFKVKKVSSSFMKGETIILSYEEIDIDRLKAVIDQTGYQLIDINQKEK